jgi:hypothetical protein
MNREATATAHGKDISSEIINDNGETNGGMLN